MRVLKTAAATTALCAVLSACAMDLTPHPQYPVVAPAAPAPEPAPAPTPPPAPAPAPAPAVDPDTPKAAPSTPVEQSTLPPPPGAKVAPPRRGSALEPRYEGDGRVVDVMMFAAAAADSVTVGKGDTLAKIAKSAGVSIDDLARANKLEPPYKLKLGQTLTVPGSAPEPVVTKGKKGKAVSRAELKPEPKAAETITVGKGDTLAKVAKKAGVSLEELAKANDIAAPYRVKAGQVLTLPGSEPAPSSPSKAEGRKAAAKAPAPTSVTVGKGQTLQSIADKQGVPVAELARLNHLKKPYRVKRGQVIKLPTIEDEAEASAPASSAPSKARGSLKSTPPRVVTAGKHDTLQSIADRAGVPVAELARLNHLKKPYRIKRGQKIKIPGRTVAAEPEAAPTKAYTVKKGDTLYSIARKFNTEPRTLADANGLDVGVRLNAGRRLQIPGGPLDTPVPTAGGRRPIDAEPSQPRPYSSLPANPGAPPNPPPPARTYVPSTPSQPLQPYTRPAPTPEASAAPPSLADADVAAAGKGLFQWPVRGPILLPYGPRPGGQRNDGMDIGAAMNEPVHAAAGGEVVYAGNSVPGFGNLVLIRHDGGWVTVYAHMANIDVKMRQTVTQGQQIGQVGQTGGVDQPQLHFEVRYAPNVKDKARQIDPMLVLPQ